MISMIKQSFWRQPLYFSVSLKMFLMVVYKKVKVTTRNLNPTHNVKQEKCLCWLIYQSITYKFKFFHVMLPVCWKFCWYGIYFQISSTFFDLQGKYVTKLSVWINIFYNNSYNLTKGFLAYKLIFRFITGSMALF